MLCRMLVPHAPPYAEQWSAPEGMFIEDLPWWAGEGELTIAAVAVPVLLARLTYTLLTRRR